MVEWIISSSALIVVVILLRFALRGKIGLRLQYALWALVLLRLLLPVSLADCAVSVENLTQKVAETEPGRVVAEWSESSLPKMSYSEAYHEVEKEYAEKGILVNGLTPEQFADFDNEVVYRMAGDISVAEVMTGIWLCGVTLIGLWFLISNLHFASKLKRNCKLLTVQDCKLPVYINNAVDTPCLFGLLRPAIYVTSEAAADEITLRHAVEHELTHYHHADHIWAILRGVCLAIHWYNPFVWWAAVLSRNDAELACDEATVRRLGEEARIAYGRTLINLTCQKHTALLVAATTMTGSKKSIKERIAFVVKKPKTALYTLIAVILVVIIAVGCTFTGAKRDLTDSELIKMAYEDAAATATMKGITMSEKGELNREGNEVQILFPVIAPKEKSGDHMKVTYSMEDKEGNATGKPYSAVIEYVEDDNGESATQDRYGIVSVKGLEHIPQAVKDCAVEHVQNVVNDLDSFWKNSMESHVAYSIVEANITKIERISTGTAAENHGINMYRLEYRLAPNHPEKVLLPNGMVMEEGRITEKSDFGQPYLLMYYEHDEDSTIWKYLCTTSTYAIENIYSTPAMLEQYGSAYTAATMELCGEYLAN